MHILFVVPYAPNPIRTRPYNLIRHLRERGHQITLLTLHANADEEGDLNVLQAEGIAVVSEPLSRVRTTINSLAALPSTEPVQAAYCWHPVLARRLQSILAGSNDDMPVDVVHVEHLRGARYALLARDTLNQLPTTPGRSVPVIWDSVDCISHLFSQAAAHSASRFGRWVTRLELPRTQRHEGWLSWQFDTILTTSQVDGAALQTLASSYRPGEPPISVLPNGVDLDQFRPDVTVEREPATLVLSGKMSYHANVTMAVRFVQEVMPLVWALRPDAKVVIVGKDPSSEVRELGQHPAVTVTGTVPDIRPYLQQATVAVAPIAYGAGVQNKVLEAMACGTPVVASPQAVSALSAAEGRDVLTGTDAGALADAILLLLSDPERRQELGSAGRAYVTANHDWSAIAGQLEKIYSAPRVPDQGHVALSSIQEH